MRSDAIPDQSARTILAATLRPGAKTALAPIRYWSGRSNSLFVPSESSEALADSPPDQVALPETRAIAPRSVANPPVIDAPE